MFENVIFSNEYLDIIDEGDQYYIKVKSNGFSMSQLDELVKEIPRLKVTQFVSIKSALMSGHSEVIALGDKKNH